MRLQELRKKRNISQLRLAIDLDMNQNSISRYETGEREADYATLIRIADYFNVTTDYLLNGTVSTPTVIYTRDPDIEIFERIELLRNEEIRQIVLLLRNADTDDLKRVYGMIELLQIGNKENEKDATTTP